MAHNDGDFELPPLENLRRMKRCLYQRELTAARCGIYTPPEVRMDIEDLKRDIAALEREIATNGTQTE